MNQIKKITAILLCFILMTANIAFAEYSDVKGKRMTDAVAFFENMGLIEGYDNDLFYPDQNVNRADFCIMLAKMLNVDEKYKEQHFIDVEVNNPAFDSIEYLYTKGLIAGIGDGKFGADEPITTNAAVKIIMSYLGYDKIAMQNGGFPTGYLHLASDIGLLKSVIYSENITKGNLCTLLFNALEAPMMKPVYFDGTYNRTILFDVLKISKYTGLVTANSDVSLYGETFLEQNEIAIDYKLYKTKIKDTSKLAGRNITYYLDENDIVISAYALMGSELELESKNIHPDTTPQSICYYENNRINRMSVADGAFYTLNGEPRTDLQSSDFTGFYGKMQLIDNNGDNKAEVVMIWSYLNYVSDGYFKDTNILYLKFPSNHLEFENKKYMVIKDGKKISVEDINVNDIISVAENNEGYIIMVSDAVESGTIKRTDYNDRNLVIEEKTLNLSQDCEERFMLGEYYNLFLDFLGNVYYAENQAVEKIGFIFKSKFDEENEKASSKIFAENGKVKTLNYADKVAVVCGTQTTKYNQADLYNSVLKPLIDDKTTVYKTGTVKDLQLVKYVLNEKDEVKTLYLAKDEGFGDWDKGYFTCNVDTAKLYREGKLTNQQCKYSGNYINWSNTQYTMRIDASTKIFLITQNQNDWKVLGVTELLSQDVFERCRIYDVTTTGAAGYILVDNTALSTNIGTANSVHGVVVKAEHTLDELDDEVYSVTLMDRKGVETEYITYNVDMISASNIATIRKNTPIKDLKKGDVVNIRADKSNNIMSFVVLNIAADEKEFYYSPTASDASIVAYSAKGNAFYGPCRYRNGVAVYKSSQAAINGYLNDGVNSNGYAACILEHSYAQAYSIRVNRALKTVTYSAKTDDFNSDHVFLYPNKYLIVVYE